MTIFKCDRCGRITNSCHNIEFKEYKNARDDRYHRYKAYDIKYEPVDLCDNCFDEVLKFFKFFGESCPKEILTEEEEHLKDERYVYETYYKSNKRPTKNDAK